MGLIKESANAYYNGSDIGGYQYTTLDDVISGFMITYVGENKLISKIQRADVVFHAKRALQELSYDTLKSKKSQEIEVCANLKMALPQDYVNYVKLARVDSSGIEHVIYPTSKTSHPFAIEQTQTDCTDCGDTSETYQYGEIIDFITNPNVLKPQETDCGTTEVTCTFSTAGLESTQHTGANQIIQAFQAGGSLSTYTAAEQQAYWQTWFGLVDEYCICLKNSNSPDHCGNQLDWDNFNIGSAPGTYGGNTEVTIPNMTTELGNNAGWSNLRGGASDLPSAEHVNRTIAKNGTWNELTNTVTLTTPTSNAWSNYKSATPSENQDDYQDDTYWPAKGQRYGLEPQHAHANGSFFIDQLRGMIHFSSNLSGETIILKYISDSLGTDDEMVVHKFAEDALYKHIIYAMLSSRSNVPERVIQRFRKERFAATRKAKLRLSNIKIEEISQVLRGKSKQIKH